MVKAKFYAFAFLAGVVAYGVPLAIIFLLSRVTRPGNSTMETIVGIVGFICIIILIIDYFWLGTDGWDWLSQYRARTIQGVLKFFAYIVISLTGIGTVLVIYWTGKRILRLAGVQPIP